MKDIARTFRTLGMRAACVVLALILAFPLAAQEATPTPDASAALVEILRDDTAREALIAELERLAAPVAAEEPAQPPASAARRIAAATQGAAENVTTGVAETWRALGQAPARLDDFGADEIAVLVDAIGDLVLVIAATVAAFLLLRSLARILYRRMGERHREAAPLARWAIFLASGLVDAAVVVLAWALGYLIAATAIGAFGEVGIRQTLYLNAFLAVEMIKVAIRLFVSPSVSELRPLAISDRGARRLYRVMNWGVSLLGYGLLLLVPIVNANASLAAGRSLSALIAIFTVLFVGISVLRNRVAVADWLVAQGRKPLPPADDDAASEADVVVEAEPGDGVHLAREPKPDGTYATLARSWHWAVLLWLGWILVTMLARSEEAVFGAVRLSLSLGAGVVIAIVLSGMLGRAIGKGLSLPPRVKIAMPLLEPRLNGFVPQLAVMLRVVMVLVVLLGAFWIGGAIDLGQWLVSDLGRTLVGTTVSILAILGVAFLLWLALTSWVEYRLNPDVGTVPTPREQTLLTLLRNALTIVLLVITLMFTLSELGLNIGPLIASAGVIGLAIGFGAQKLVQDVITGIFIQFENAMNVGDVVTAGTTTGVVEKLTIRSVSLRDVNGIYHLIPFSSVDLVSNFTRDFSHHVVDMGVAYRENIDEVKQAMLDAFDEIRRDPEHGPNILADLEWFGINEFADSAVIVRARIKTLPGKQWATGRAYNGVVKRVFDERGIEIPFPHTTLYFGENKKGETQPVRIEDARTAE